MAILQYAFDNDEPQLYNPWLEPVQRTICLLEEFTQSRVVAHNLTFDWQKIQSFYNAIVRLRDTHGNTTPIDYVDDMVTYFYTERERHCLKPAAAVCTLLVCQKELGGTGLAAKEVRVRQIPRVCAEPLCDLLNNYTDLPSILFAKRRDGGWHVGESDKGDLWADVILKFAPSNGLKEVARHVLGVEDTQKIGSEVLPPVMPYELGYCPFAHLMRKAGCTEQLWPDLLADHITFWNNNEAAVKYALDDIHLLRKLDHHLGKRDTDFDGELAVQVASCRQAGFKIDVDQLRKAIRESTEVVETARINVDAHKKVQQWIAAALDPMEQHVVSEGCDKSTLKKIVRNFVAEEREECDCDNGCPRCEYAGVIEPGPMPVAKRAQHVLDVRKHKKRLQLYDKLAIAQEAFPGFRVIGTKSGRMSGTDGLNYHGIDGSKEIRSIFTLAGDGEIVSGGDMNSQELAIAAAVMQDGNLAFDIEVGRSLHGEFAAAIMGVPYEQIMERRDDKGSVEGQTYAKAKVCLYAILYGASAYNISQVLGCPVDEAEEKIAKFFSEYPLMKKTREAVKQSLQCLRSVEGGRIEVGEPAQSYIDSCFGFRRSFEIEMLVMRSIVDAMNNVKTLFEQGGPLATWANEHAVRREEKGSQTYKGCILSALFGGAFSLQGKIQRAALNHLIQSAGRTCTLRVQRRIWDDVQPSGVHPFRVKLMSVHDEVVCVSKPETAKQIEQTVYDEMKSLCETVPLLSLDWATDVGSWYGVKSAEDGLRCGWKSA